MTWLLRIILACTGVVAGWFVPHDDIGYTIIQFVVFLLMILAASVLLLYCQRLISIFTRSSTPKR